MRVDSIPLRQLFLIDQELKLANLGLSVKNSKILIPPRVQLLLRRLNLSFQLSDCALLPLKLSFDPNHAFFFGLLLKFDLLEGVCLMRNELIRVVDAEPELSDGELLLPEQILVLLEHVGGIELPAHLPDFSFEMLPLEVLTG